MIIYALMLPDENLQAATRLAESNNRNQMRPAVFSGMSVGSFPEQRLVIEPTPAPTRNKHKQNPPLFLAILIGLLSVCVGRKHNMNLKTRGKLGDKIILTNL